LLAGPAMNLLFALLVIVIIYSVIGVDIQDPDSGVVQHIVIDPLKSLIAACNYIGMVFVAVVQLFDPQTAADTVSNSTSIVGIAVLSKTAAEQGIESFVMFAAMLSVSLGIMNMLPIPPLDGGRFIVEVFQRIFHKDISYRTLAIISWLGMLLFIGFFLFMLNQDVQRFVLGNW
jgi:regulator of sigma E protease